MTTYTKKQSHNKNYILSIPENTELENYLINCLINNFSNLKYLISEINQDLFNDAENKIIFRAIEYLIAKKKDINIISIQKTITEIFLSYDEVEASTFLTSKFVGLELTFTTKDRVECWIKELKELGKRRQLIASCEETIKNCGNLDIELQNVIEPTEKTVFNFHIAESTKDFSKLSKIIENALHSIESCLNDPKHLTGLDTGYSELNKFTLGLQKSDLIILAARPSMGKTAFAINIALNILKFNDNACCALFSLEMSKEQLISRILSITSRLNLYRLKLGNLTQNELQKLYLKIDTIYNMNLFIDDSAYLNTNDIKSKCRKLKMEKGLDVIIIDYLQLLYSSKKSEFREQEIADISRNLKILAKEIDVPIIALSQLNRKLEERTNKVPILSDLRESGAIEQDADIVIFIHRDEVYNKNSTKKNVAEIHIAKHRNGQIGSFDLYFNAEVNYFGNITQSP